MSEAIFGPAIPVIDAAKTGDADRIRALLKDNMTTAGQADPLGRTALHYAARLGYLPVVEELIGAGVPVDPFDEDGFTPLIRAVEFGHAGIAELLMRAGADPLRPLPDGRNARSIAATSDNPTMLRLFDDN